MLFEKERKEAEEALRKRLALETEAALVQQERDLTALIGRLEVGFPFNYFLIYMSKAPSGGCLYIRNIILSNIEKNKDIEIVQYINVAYCSAKVYN